MANDYIRRWVSSQTAQRKPVGGAMNPEAALQNNPFYVGPPGSPVPRWVTDPLGRPGRTPAWPNPLNVPPEATLKPRPTFLPDSNIGADALLEPVISPPSPARPISQQDMIDAIRSSQRSPMPMPFYEGGPQSGPLGSPLTKAPDPNMQAGPPNPFVEWGKRQQMEEAMKSGQAQPMLWQRLSGGPSPAPMPSPQMPAQATPQPTRSAAPPSLGPKGVTEPGRPKPMTMAEAFNTAQQRIGQRPPFKSRLG